NRAHPTKPPPPTAVTPQINPQAEKAANPPPHRAPNSPEKDPATKVPATNRPPQCGATQAKAHARSHQAQINAREAADRTKDQTQLATPASAHRQAPLPSPHLPKAADAPNSRPKSLAALPH